MAEQFDLTSIGVEPIEWNVCEDSFENRQKLTTHKIPYQILEPGFIEISFDQMDDYKDTHLTSYSAKKILLVKPRDPWSDYLPFDELPLEYMETAPAWIPRHLTKYKQAIEDGLPARRIPILPKRCRWTRADGSRCWGWSWPAESCKGLCRGHAPRSAFNAAEEMTKLSDTAKLRMSQLTGPAIEALEDLLLNSPVPAVRLKAATEVFDRVGIRGGTELTISGQIDHSVQDPGQAVRERLNSLQERMLAAHPAPEPEEILELEASEIQEVELTDED